MRAIIVIKRLFLLLTLPLIWLACSKQHFLDAKPSTNLVVPTQLSDFQALLDNTAVFGLVPTLGEASADNYFFPYAYWMGRDTREKNAYAWAPDIFGGQGGQLEWNTPYQQVFYANVVLDGLGSKSSQDSVAEWDALEGSALFLRAFAFYNVAQVFAPVYDSGRSSIDSGIALRLHADVTVPSRRSTVGQTYQQIIDDLTLAEGFLPAAVPNGNRNRPVRVAAQALLARVYLSMRNYTLARAYADSALQFYNVLMDYNSIDSNTIPLFSPTNPETLYQASFIGGSQAGSSSVYLMVIAGGFYTSTRIDTMLLQSYDSNDLRRTYYYHYLPPNLSYLNASYSGTNFPFGGMATDELYLIRAECAARAGDMNAAIGDINTLVSKRWHWKKSGLFPGYTVHSAQEALDTVLVERRKELTFRGLRWTDLRRFNAEGANITLMRQWVISPGDTLTYTLKPNTDLWVLPIPPDVISLSNMSQNPRN